MTCEYPLDNFPCGLVVTTVEERRVLSANQYFYLVSKREPFSVERIGDVLTPASKIVVESFIMPMLLHQGHCEEIQLTLETPQSERIPILVNASVVTADNRSIFWVITTAQQRDSLYQELINLRNDLEIRAEKLEVLSQTDELTGLMNRRAFILQANKLIKQANRLQNTYSFFMLDIDHFKDINDQYGHDIGDEVLRKIAQLLKNNCRESDILARIGGEEFAIFTMNSDNSAPAHFAEKLLAVIRTEKIHGIDVTVSIGVATSLNASFEELYKAADLLLYEAKHRGRDQCSTSD